MHMCIVPLQNAQPNEALCTNLTAEAPVAVVYLHVLHQHVELASAAQLTLVAPLPFMHSAHVLSKTSDSEELLWATSAMQWRADGVYFAVLRQVSS